jgi:hypothetical protein
MDAPAGAAMEGDAYLSGDPGAMGAGFDAGVPFDDREVRNFVLIFTRGWRATCAPGPAPPQAALPARAPPELLTTYSRARLSSLRDIMHFTHLKPAMSSVSEVATNGLSTQGMPARCENVRGTRTRAASATC